MEKTKIKINNLSFWYGNHCVLDSLSTQFKEHTISAIIGPSGIGKSTFLMVLNRLWESIPQARMKGRIVIHFSEKWQDIYQHTLPPSLLRQKMGTIFQIPNPLPMSIYKNIAFPLKIIGEKNKDYIQETVKSSLRRVQLWDEVHDRLTHNALDLSGGQQQRLCIARALVVNPEIILFDEPTSSLDTKSRDGIEDLLVSLKQHCTIIMISHYLDQVKRIADSVFEMKRGVLIQV